MDAKDDVGPFFLAVMESTLNAARPEFKEHYGKRTSNAKLKRLKEVRRIALNVRTAHN